ncbi:MAG: hypothetical protein J7K09_04025, partial [Desulfuromusa sp.]|nr:hypothetical protein [Desulfuromusa sp.]
MNRYLNNKWILILCLTGTLLFKTVNAVAATHTVGSGGDFNTIAEAITAAAATGDDILVLPGVYEETGLSFLGKAVNLHSSEGARRTIIDCEKNGQAFVIDSGETAATIIDGFTIQNGYAANGGAVVISNNSSPTIRNCIFRNNSATNQGGVFYLDNASPTLSNCLFYGNSAGYYGGVSESHGTSNVTITNCTFAHNTASDGGAFEAFGSNSTYTVSNSIFWGNSALNGSQISWYEQDGIINLLHCIVQGGEVDILKPFDGINYDVSNIDSDPLFHGYGNYHVRPGSPSIDA